MRVEGAAAGRWPWERVQGRAAWFQSQKLTALGALGIVLGVVGLGAANGQPSHRNEAAMDGARGSVPGSKACRVVAIEGEVKAGQYFERRLGDGLEAMLEPLASGWILRVLPYGEPRGQRDYAELATPPYQSVNPLLVSTDFSFRAQDVVAWNPRRFHFAVSAREFRQLGAAYAEYRKAGSAAAEARLAELAGRAAEGTLRILDARLVPGTANQAQTAATVATHLEATAHSVDPPVNGKDTPLGRVTWLRFRMEFTVPAGFRVERGLAVEQGSCR